MKVVGIILVIFIGCYVEVFAQNLMWSFNSQGDGNAIDMITDVHNNIYSIGYFKSDKIKIGKFELKNSNVGTTEAYISKLDNNGSVLWAKCISGDLDDQPLGVSIDKTGHIIVMGYTESNIIKYENKKIITNYAGETGMFLIKMDSEGKIIWMQSSFVRPSKHIVAKDGSIYLIGDVKLFSNIKFGDDKFKNMDKSFLLVKYHPDGKVNWVRFEAEERGDNIVIDPAGRLIVSGTYEKIISSPNRLSDDTKSIRKNTNVFVSKYLADGSRVWTNTLGGNGKDECKALKCDNHGNVFMVVRYTSLIVSVGKIKVNGNGDNLLTVKYNPKGELLWVQQTQGAGHNYPIFLNLDSQGNAIVCGHYMSNQITFDKITVNNDADHDIFIVKYSGTGKVLWARITGSTIYDYVKGQNIDEFGNLYIYGVQKCLEGIFYSGEKLFVEKYNNVGDLVWKLNNGNKNISKNFVQTPYTFKLDDQHNILISGYAIDSLPHETQNKSQGIFVVKINGE